MSDWKKIRKQTRRQVRGGLEQARRYARKLEEETAPQRRRIGAEARRRAPGFAAFAIATAVEMMRQRRGDGARPRRTLRFGQTVLLLGVAAFLAALLLRPKR
ncbi:MAG: hypothetical protein ACRD16_11330 [Thermoanaerobaculia bacterium]